MASKLTNEMRKELAANPHQAIPVVDEESGDVYYIVAEDFLLGAGQEDEQSREQLRALIRAGINSPHVSRDEGDARIRARIQHFANKSA